MYSSIALRYISFLFLSFLIFFCPFSHLFPLFLIFLLLFLFFSSFLLFSSFLSSPSQQAVFETAVGFDLNELGYTGFKVFYCCYCCFVVIVVDNNTIPLFLPPPLLLPLPSSPTQGQPMIYGCETTSPLTQSLKLPLSSYRPVPLIPATVCLPPLLLFPPPFPLPLFPPPFPLPLFPPPPLSPSLPFSLPFPLPPPASHFLPLSPSFLSLLSLFLFFSLFLFSLFSFSFSFSFLFLFLFLSPFLLQSPQRGQVMDAEKLAEMVEEDVKEGRVPVMVIASLGNGRRGKKKSSNSRGGSGSSRRGKGKKERRRERRRRGKNWFFGGVTDFFFFFPLSLFLSFFLFLSLLLLDPLYDLGALCIKVIISSSFFLFSFSFPLPFPFPFSFPFPFPSFSFSLLFLRFYFFHRIKCGFMLKEKTFPLFWLPLGKFPMLSGLYLHLIHKYYF